MLLMAFPQHNLYIGHIHPHNHCCGVFDKPGIVSHYVAGISFAIIAAGVAYELNIPCHLSISYQCLNLTMCEQKIKTSIMKVKELAHG